MIKNSLQMISKGAFLAGSFAAVLFVQSEAQAGYAVQYENSLGNAKDNDNFGNSIFFQYSGKIDDNWSFTGEMLEEFTLQSNKATPAATDNMKFSHGYIRTNFKRKNLFSVGDWKGALGIRYVFPTAAGSQTQGSLGVLTFRPELSGKMGDLSLTAMLVVGPYLQRTKVAYTGSENGNPFFITGFRLLPGYDFTPNWFFASDFLIYNTASFGAGGVGTATVNSIDNEFEFGFKGDLISQWAVSVVAHTVGPIKGVLTGDKPKVYSGRSWEYNLRFAKEF